MEQRNRIQHVFIIGCKGIPAQYGGYETFVEKLTQHQKNRDIKYHVACAVDAISGLSREFEHNDVHCFNIQWKRLGSFRAVLYDIDAIKWSIAYSKKHGIRRPIIYILACRIGPFMPKLRASIKAIGGIIYVNPDGHEWMRGKWSFLVRKYWKSSERMMIKNADLVVCDSKTMQMYIQHEYMGYHPNTCYIAYGAETICSSINNRDNKLITWYKDNKINPYQYFLVVGRFVPENNYETMITEFMHTKTKKDFVLITNRNSTFLKKLKRRTGFMSDPRIRFVGTVYDQELLKKIRENAYAYLHGHEVGGTNPSLLEALSSTKINLLLNVPFNTEVAKSAAFYWDKTEGVLSELIDRVDGMKQAEIDDFGKKAHKRIIEDYSWDSIISQYENRFIYGDANR